MVGERLMHINVQLSSPAKRRESGKSFTKVCPAKALSDCQEVERRKEGITYL